MMIISFIAAFLAGVFASMGVGGGMILILYLTIFAGAAHTRAAGINLIFFIPIAITSIIIHSKNKLIEWRKIAPVIITGAIGCFIGVSLIDLLGTEIIRKFFGVFVLLVGVRELFYKEKPNP